jgi:hypothetical protein
MVNNLIDGCTYAWQITVNARPITAERIREHITIIQMIYLWI